jgi:hypothetical protein
MNVDSLAASSMTVDSFISNLATTIINPLLLLLFAVAVIYFLWGVLSYIKGADDPGKRQEGAMHIFYGLIGMLIMVGVYGILEMITNTVFGS